jgi:sugar lactone lactonase YvrE
MNTAGSPSGLAIGASGSMFVADLDHRAVVMGTGDDASMQIVVAMYEDKEFLGPHSIVYGKDGSFFFTDSGPFGETGVHNAKGSVYCVTGGASQMLKPLILGSLAYPTGLCLAPAGTGEVLYVCETMANRVLRFVRQATAWHCSVFHQFSGRIGPQAIAVVRPPLPSLFPPFLPP